MDTQALHDAAPSWTAMQAHSTRFQFDLIAMYLETIVDAIECDHDAPDRWESTHLAYAIVALAKSHHCAALTFAKVALTGTPHPGPGSRSTGDPEVATLAQLRRALRAVRVRRQSVA